MFQINVVLAGADVDFADMVAAGEFLDLAQDQHAMMKELIAHDRVGGENDEGTSTFDAGGVRVLGVGRTDDFGPFVADGLLRGVAADLVIDENLCDERTEVFGRAFAHAPRNFERHATQIGDQLFGGAAELGWLVRHFRREGGAEVVVDVRARTTGCSGRKR